MPKKKSKTYEQFRDEWYKKLAKEGFTDIENDEDHLKFYTSRFAADFTQETWAAKTAYYQMAENFLNDYKFETHLERAIWEYHTNALSYRDIAKILKKLRLVKRMNRTTIYQIIKRLKVKMFDMYMVKHRESHGQ